MGTAEHLEGVTIELSPPSVEELQQAADLARKPEGLLDVTMTLAGTFTQRAARQFLRYFGSQRRIERWLRQYRQAYKAENHPPVKHRRVRSWRKRWGR